MLRRKQKQQTYSSIDLQAPKPTLLQKLFQSLPTPPPTKKEAANTLYRYLNHDHFEDSDREPTQS